MNMTIFLVCTIFCSIQKLNENENNVTVKNKRKFINEQDITLENNLINIYNEYPNEEPIIKKQKHIYNNNAEGLNFNNYNYISCNMYAINDIHNNICEILKYKTIIDNELLIQNKDVESEQNFFEDVFNPKSLLNNNNLCNKEDFIDYCNLFSLELLDNPNTDKNTKIDRINENKNQLEHTNNLLNLDKKYKINNNIDTSVFLKISRDDIKRYANSFDFRNIFDIIFQDLFNILTNFNFFLNTKNEQLTNFILSLEKEKKYDTKVFTFIKITNEIINNINADFKPDNDRSKFIGSIIEDKYIIAFTTLTLRNKLKRSRAQLISEIKKNKITYKDVFNFTIENIKCLTDDNIKTLFILGIKNIFSYNYNKPYYRLMNILIFLYAFNNHKDHYEINWDEQFFQLLSISDMRINKYYLFKNTCVNLLKTKTSFLDYKLYIAINSAMFDHDLYIYEQIQKNKSKLEIISCLIDLVNKAKCKLLNIEKIKNIEQF